MLIIKDEDKYYFVPKSCSKAKGSAKKEQPDQNQYYIGKKFVENIGPNKFDFLEYLVSEEARERIDMEIVEKTKGKGRTTQRKATAPITKAVSKELEEDVHQNSEAALEDILTNPYFLPKRITEELSDSLDATYGKNLIVELEKEGTKLPLSSNEMDKLVQSWLYMKNFYKGSSST